MSKQESTFTSLPYTALRDGAYEAIRNAILHGKLKPGQRVLEVEIAQELGVSRAPVREALRTLEREGLVHSLPHRGTYVTELSPQDAYEIYSLRAALESLAVTTVMQSGNLEVLDRLEELVQEMEARAGGDFGAMVETDLSFHETLCRAANHRRLLDTWLSMLVQIRAFVSISHMQYLAPMEIARRHRVILEALRAGEVQKAAESLTNDILDVGRHIASALAAAVDSS